MYFYLRFGVSYRDLEEILVERGVVVDHATLNRWVVKYSPKVALKAQSSKRTPNRSWRMDETYVRVKGYAQFWSVVLQAVLQGESDLSRHGGVGWICHGQLLRD